MAPVDEKQGKWRGPAAGHHMARPDDGHHRLFQAGFGQGAPQVRQRVDGALALVEELRVEILLAGLLFFAAAVVVDGKEDLPAPSAGAAQVKGALAAIAADFQARPHPPGRHRGLVEGLALDRIEKPLGAFDEGLGDIHTVADSRLWVVVK